MQSLATHDTQLDTVEMQSSPDSLSVDTKKSTKSNADMKPKTPVIAVILLVAIVSGIGTGIGLHKLNAQQSTTSLTGPTESGNIKAQVPTSSIKVGDVYGSPNEETFKDSAEGVLQAGGFDGEGTHKLFRPGGISQTVYLTSSVTDLDKFVGAKVKVWGETNSAKKAGWFMDVGRVKVLELNAEIPEEDKPTATPEPKPTATPKAGNKK